MDIVEVNKYVIEEMGLAEENGDDIAVRLYLSNNDSIEIWFDKENNCYMWSDGSFGYEDIYAIMNDIFEWLHEESLSVINMETV